MKNVIKILQLYKHYIILFCLIMLKHCAQFYGTSNNKLFLYIKLYISIIQLWSNWKKHIAESKSLVNI